MKRKVTKTDLIGYIKNLDKRALAMSDNDIDEVILQGFAELSTVSQVFTNEEVVDLTPYITAGEDKVVIDVEDDVTEIYDLYITTEDNGTLKQGVYIQKDSDSNPKFIYEDDRYKGRVHVDVANLPINTNNAVIKYFFIPDSDFVDAYLDGQVHLALKNALGACLYDILHDAERAAQKRAAMVRTTNSIVNSGAPKDWQSDKPSMFPSGV